MKKENFKLPKRLKTSIACMFFVKVFYLCRTYVTI